MNTLETAIWAEDTFGQCNLGDLRRTKRLITYAQQQADAPGSSTIGSSNGDAAKSEGAYRLLRNTYVEANSIMNGVALRTVELCKGRQVLLAIQDTTSVEVAHVPLRKELTSSGSLTGFLVHSTLMVDAEPGFPIGLMDQSTGRILQTEKRNGLKRKITLIRKAIAGKNQAVVWRPSWAT